MSHRNNFRYSSSDSDSSTNWDTSDSSSSDSDTDNYQPDSKKQKKDESFEKDKKLISELNYGYELKCNYKWVITDYLKVSADLRYGQKIESSVFAVGANDEYEFQLHFYPKGNDANKNYTSLYLQLKSSEEVKLPIHLKCNFYNLPKHLEKSYETEETVSIGHRLGFRRLVKSECICKNSAYLDRDRLVLNCDISFTLNKPDKNKLKVVNDLEALFDTGDYSDFTLEVQDKKFKVHKYILAARSTVFAAMFKHDMKEKKDNSVKIVDFSADVMKELLQFAYCGEVKHLNVHAKELLAAAEMYNFADLKKLCESELVKSLSIGNVVEVLNFAELHNSNVLKEQALDYFVGHVKDVVDTESFKAMAAEQSPILAQVITKMASKNNL